ncbi:MAG TPA: TonB-dependent receptor plug domain-containing protein [Opitutaceae bacterium]|nr:TonB-dependent receptor plug domain-containing protein [Opitutaceae bacterium]
MTALNKPRRVLISLAAISGLLGFFPGARAEETTPNKDETVELPQFTVRENKVNAYQSQEALSASRVAMPILDIPQTISVVPAEFLEDSKSMRMLDAAKYVTPVVENTLPFGGDRYTIRGFTVSAEFVDGSNISGPDGYSMSQMPYNIERIEIIKGPNAILVPGGSPGGVMNPITKAPVLGKDSSSVTLEFSDYYARGVSFDVNQSVAKDGKMAARMIGAFWDFDYFIKDQFRRGYEISPSFSYQLSPAHKLTLKADFVQNRDTNLGGLPIDPSIGSTGYAQIARGLPRNWQFGDKTDSRHRRTQRVSAELLSTLGSHVSSRFYLMGDHVHRRDVGGTSASISNGGGGSVNPSTGRYEPGVNWTTTTNADGTVTPVATSVPVTDPSTWIYTRNNGFVDLDYLEAHFKNDYAAKFDFSLLSSTTIGGVAANSSRVRYKSWTPAPRPSVPANDLNSITYPAYVFPPILPGLTTDNRGTNRTGVQTDLQTFVYETLSVWKERLQVSGGVSRFFGVLSRVDNTGTAILAALPNSPAYNLTSNATSFGVVVKPIKEVSFFYSRNTTGGTMPGSLNAGVTDPTTKVAVGGQKEFGAKTSLFNGRLTASIAHFEIAQTNYAVTNSEYYALVAAGRLAEAAALPQALYVNLQSKGWEGELTYSIGKNLTLLCNYTNLKVRQPITEVRLRGVPDEAYGIYADYRFTEGALTGFGVNVGLDNKSDVAGTNATGYTTSKPIAGVAGGFVPNQPTFMVAGRTLINIGFTYKYGQNWSAAFTVLNAFDKDYIMAAGSRTSIVVGTPRAWKSSVTYKF